MKANSLFFTVALLVAGPALAQTNEGVVERVEREAIESERVQEEVLESILANRETVSERIKGILEKLPEITQSIETADETFDQIVAELKRQAEFGRPGGDFVLNIDNLITAAQQDAGAARTAGFLDFEKEFLDEADNFNRAKAAASQYYDSLSRRIRAVETERERIVFMIKLKRYEEAQAVVQDGLAQLRETEQVLADIERMIPQEPGTPD